MIAKVAKAFLAGMRWTEELAESGAPTLTVAVWYGDRFYYEYDLKEIVEKERR